MDILDLLLRPGTYVLGLAVYVATWLTRRLVQTAWPSLKKQADANAPDITYLTSMSRWWNEVILYAVPVAYGAVVSLVNSAFLFDGFDGGAKFMYGAGVGWCSSFLYKGLKKVIATRAGLQPQDLISEVTKT